MPAEEVPGYVTVEQVREATGVRPEDFKLQADTDADLTADEVLAQVLERWIGYVKGEIDDHCGRDFLDAAAGDLDAVHPTIKNVAERSMARWVQLVRSHRDAALIRIDEWRVGVNIVDEVLTDHMRATLDRHMRASRRLPFRGFVSRAGDDG